MTDTVPRRRSPQRRRGSNKLGLAGLGVGTGAFRGGGARSGPKVCRGGRAQVPGLAARVYPALSVTSSTSLVTDPSVPQFPHSINGTYFKGC